MSELDFEEELTTEEPPASFGGPEQIIDAPNKDDQNNSKAVADSVMSDGEIKSESDSGEISGLEEGEIKDPAPSYNRNTICRFFLRGICNMGSRCRFLHTGVSAYRMLETVSAKTVPHYVTTVHEHSFPFPAKSDFQDSYSTAHVGDNWDRALKQAKAMMMSARDKKETDIEFDEKKLYLSCEQTCVGNVPTNSNGKCYSIENKDKYKVSSLSFRPDGQDHVEKETRLNRNEFHSKSNVRSQDWVDPWRRSRSRTRRSSSHSSFSSRSSAGHSSRDSSSSSHSFSRSPENKSRRKKSKSKLNMMIAKSRSRKRFRSWSPPYSSSSLSGEKSSSFSSSRSRSRSSSESRFSKIYSNEYVPPKSKYSGSSDKEKSQLHSSKKRKFDSQSSLEEKKLKAPAKPGFEIDSSDITVSCISCTSLSCSDISSLSESESVSRNEKISSNTNRDDVKLSSGGNHLKITGNVDSSKSNSKKNMLPRERKPKVEYSSQLCKNPVKASNKESDKYFCDYKHQEKIPNENFGLEKAMNELTNNEFTMDKPTVHSPKSKSGKKQDEYSLRKNINFDLKCKLNAPEKSSNNIFRESREKVKQPLSRREQLLKQLEAVELAIAKKKHL